jgi:membrane-bound serine protease (ClpP class)
MYTVIILLLAISLVFLICESLLPGFGVCGFIGIILLAVSAVLTAAHVPFGGVIVVFELIFAAAVCMFFIRLMFRRQKSSKIVLTETLDMDKADIKDLSYLFGKTGKTTTAVKPEGKAVIDGTTLEVYSTGPFIPADRRVQVVEISSRRVIVKELAENCN